MGVTHEALMGFTPSLIHIVALVCFFLLSPWLVSKWA
jgi:hypothetical protein